MEIVVEAVLTGSKASKSRAVEIVQDWPVGPGREMGRTAFLITMTECVFKSSGSSNQLG